MNMGRNITVFFIISLCLIQVQQILGFSIKKFQSDIDCSQFVDDDDIINSFPFIVHRNPVIQNSVTTFALMDKNHHVVRMQIVNKDCVPPHIYCLKHLSKLEVFNTSFSDYTHRLPSQIEHLASSLTDLHIHNTKITHLPEQIGKLKRLERLKLSNTGLISLPDSIGNLPTLKFLILPHNNLTSLPLTLTKIQSLRQIILLNNSNLRSIQSLNGHSTLRMLDTRNCPIAVLPQNMPQLIELRMTNNILTKLTGIETLGQGTINNKSFDFDHNHLESIPPEIGHVRHLYRLNLADNQLKNLPADIFHILTLADLNIQHNPFHPRDLKSIISKFRHRNPKLQVLHD